MSEFAEFLAAQNVDQDVIQQALRYYIADRFPDVTPSDMRAELERYAAPQDVAAGLSRLERAPEIVDAAALFVLSAGWAESEQTRQLVRDVVVEAKGKMPLIEVAVISVSCMYGLYLLLTKNVKRSETRVIRRKDGSFEMKNVTEFHDPQGALGAIVNIFRGRNDSEQP